MNRREFFKHPAIPAVAVGAACVTGGVAGAMSPAEDEKYMRVPANGTEVCATYRRGRDWLAGKTGSVCSVQIGQDSATLLVQFDQSLGPWGMGAIGFLNSTYCRLDEIQVIDPNPEWVLVPRPKKNSG